MGMSGTGQANEAVPRINVTPLIDVLLVLLIIFMVITPVKPSKFEAKVPAEPKDQQNIEVPNLSHLLRDQRNNRNLTLNNEPAGV
jgi:biopolymer transport protein ExbD/biopolymer transport protein TolR